MRKMQETPVILSMGCSLGLVFITPWAVVAFIAAVGAYGFMLWMDKHAEDKMQKLEKRFAELQKHMQEHEIQTQAILQETKGFIESFKMSRGLSL